MELMGVCGCLSESYKLHLQPDGSWQHDSVYPAVFTLAAPSGAIQMILFKDRAPVHIFRMRFGPETVGQGAITCMPCKGVELECEVQEQASEEGDGEDDDDNGGARFLTVDSLRLT